LPGWSIVAVRLIFLGGVDVLKTNIDVALVVARLSRTYQEAVTVEDSADGAGEVAMVRA